MGRLILFPRPPRPPPPPPPPPPPAALLPRGFSLALQVRPGAVALMAPGLELWLTPGQARELGRELIDCAAAAEARP